METRYEGTVKNLVRYAAGTDARETVVDAKTGAKISLNIDGVDYDEQWGEPEPFYIEHGENLYDAYNCREARTILSNIRKGYKYPDMPESPKPKSKVVSGKRKSGKKIGKSGSMSIGRAR